MNLFDILKQFKTIEPDAQFTAHAKAEILMSPRSRRRTLGAVFSFLHVIETSAAVVLAGLFILVLTGSFSGSHSIAPIQYSVIDPQGLHAEAEAIDMQIQLANVDYPQSTKTSAVATTTSASVMRVAALKAPTSPTIATSTPQLAEATSTAASSSMTIDQALKMLSQ